MTAAAIAFITVMLLGMTGLTTLVWRDRRRTTPPPPGMPASFYHDTVAELGDPNHIDFDMPPPDWPTDNHHNRATAASTKQLTKRDIASVLTKLSNEH